MENQTYRAVNLRTGQTLAERVSIAQDFRSRSKGLLGKQGLDKDEGLLIKPCNSIHTFFMKFPIDAIFLDKRGRIVKICTGIKPWRLCAALLAGYMVLETSADSKASKLSVIGDMIEFK